MIDINLDTPKRLARGHIASNDRRGLVRARWRRIGEKQMLLLRQAKYDEIMKRQQEIYAKRMEKELEEAWQPYLDDPSAATHSLIDLVKKGTAIEVPAAM